MGYDCAIKRDIVLKTTKFLCLHNELTEIVGYFKDKQYGGGGVRGFIYLLRIADSFQLLSDAVVFTKKSKWMAVSCGFSSTRSSPDYIKIKFTIKS